MWGKTPQTLKSFKSIKPATLKKRPVISIYDTNNRLLTPEALSGGFVRHLDIKG